MKKVGVYPVSDILSEITHFSDIVGEEVIFTLRVRLQLPVANKTRLLDDVIKNNVQREI